MFPGEVLDRFGPPDGRYLSPPGTPFTERGLPPSSLDGSVPNFGYHQYEVLRQFPAEVGYIAPAMGQPGGGLQVFVNGSLIPEGVGQRVNVQWLIDKGYLKEVVG
nr:TNT domain-containing protein [Knoellia sp. DB2414S]